PTDVQSSGFYSMKRPDAANDPRYAAKTAQNGAKSAPFADSSAEQAPSPQNASSSASAQGYGAYRPDFNRGESGANYTSNRNGDGSAYTGSATGAHYTSGAAHGPQSYRNPQYASAAGAAGVTSAVPRKKEKRKYPLGALIACCLICALLSGAVAAAGVLAFAPAGRSQANSGGSAGNTVINVDKSATNNVSAVAKKVIPSVVGIRVTTSVTSFFGMSQESSGEGSGVIYTADGYIITNYHVISAAVSAGNKSSATIGVFLSSDPETAVSAKVIGYNSESDLAVIKIEKTGLTPADFADSDALEVGEAAVAVGNPGGLQYMSSVSSGVISGLNRTIKLEGTSQMKLIQTDAAINPGNSGGALTNAAGEIIGINSSKISSTDFEGMGFAIPSNYVKQICDDIINNKDVRRAYLGVKISTDYDAETLISMGYPAGAVVEAVDESSPAYSAGIRASDIITSFDGVEISSYSDYNKARLGAKPGQKVSLTVYRNGRNYTVSVTLGESQN
ncbi:MAG: S1C family serine protease, partial [Acutalibacteraceae bacterium]